MSYSFVVRASDKAEALRMVEAELAKIVEAQPVHSADQAQALAAAAAFIGVLLDDDTKNVQVNVHGSLGWVGTSETPSFINASVGISAALTSREPAE